MLCAIAALLLASGDIWRLGKDNWHLDPVAVVIAGLVFLALAGVPVWPWRRPPG